MPDPMDPSKAKWVNGADPMWEGKDAYPSQGSYPFFKMQDAKDYHSRYGIGLDFAMKPLGKMLAFALTANTTFESSDKYQDVEGVEDANPAVSVGAEITSAPIDGLNLKLGFDGGMNFTTKNKKDKDNYLNAFAWDMLFDARYKWVGAGLYVSSPGTKFAADIDKATDMKSLQMHDLAFYTKFETKGNKGDASNLLEGLDAGVYLGFHKLLTFAKRATTSNPKMQFPLVMKVWGAYTVKFGDSMWLKPYVDLWGNTNHPEFDKDKKNNKDPSFGLAYDIGVTYSPVEKVEIDAKWASGKLASNSLTKIINKSCTDASEDIGKLVLKLTVKY